MSDNKEDYMILGQGVTKVFKDFWGRPKVRAVTDVDIKVKTGGVFGLLGPNGAGKSTLMKMILGHLYPNNGKLTVLGKAPTDVDTKKRLGYLPERSYLYKHMTPMQTLHFFGNILELPRDIIEQRGKQLLDMVGLSHASNRIAGEFSHGMGRRLGLAQALLNDPDLLLLDEPTAGLDPLGCREVKNLILSLADRGKTVVLTSHLLADVEDVSDELLIMYGGRVQEFGTCEELLAKQDKLQITIPATTHLKDVLSKMPEQLESGVAVANYPRQTLEEYFIGVVERASVKGDTAGARAGKGVADYLKSDQKHEGCKDKTQAFVFDDLDEDFSQVSYDAKLSSAEESVPEPKHFVEEPVPDIELKDEAISTPISKAKLPSNKVEGKRQDKVEVKKQETIVNVSDDVKSKKNLGVRADAQATRVDVTIEDVEEHNDQIDQDFLDSITK
ncbi:MAG: ABC transporter ATP-binding protein [Lentisphaeria bacterium]|nr:ABC transporter ATP-binding protein [Lentisphaeria bacterium]